MKKKRKSVSVKRRKNWTSKLNHTKYPLEKGINYLGFATENMLYNYKDILVYKEKKSKSRKQSSYISMIFIKYK